MLSSDLYTIIWNALLFTDKKSQIGPVVEFTLNADQVVVRSADNYSGLVERRYLDSYVGLTESTWYMQKEDLQEIAKKLRVEPTEQVDLISLREQAVECPDAQAWQQFDYLNRHTLPQSEAIGFAVAHDRWKLLGRVRSGGDYPIVVRLSQLQVSYDDSVDIIQFRIGPDIRGYVAPLDDVVLKPEWRL